MKDDATAAVLPQELARTARRTHVRWTMLGLIFIGTIINYLDRANMSVVAPLISKEFSISPVAMGFLFSAFSWAFAIATIPGGYLLDRFGTRLVYGLCLAAWSVATTLQVLAGGFASLFGLRFSVGAAEAPAFPANNMVATSWFPQREIGVAASVCSMGIYVGTALLTPVEFYIAQRYGWRAVFLLSGLAGLIWTMVWFLFYREPRNSRRASEEELAYIQQGKAVGGPASPRGGFRWDDCVKLLSFRQMWGVCIGKFAATTTLYFFLTWFPTYLIQARGMTMLHAGAAAIGPYFAAGGGVMFGGWWGDWMVRRGYPLTTARKLPMVIGLLLTGSIVLANFTTSNALVMVILCFAFFAQGMSSTTWVILSEISPLKLVGMTGSIASFASNIAGIVTPITIGFIVQKTGSFEWALGFCAVVSLVGVLSYTLLMGPIKRLDVE